MRAFLSHSSEDKSFVTLVANQLGRQFCVYDTFEFRTGDDFRKAIRTALEKSAIFVLFASQKALESAWVKFEENEAELLSIKGSIMRPLVFLMNDGTTHQDLPEWLKRSRVRTANSPKAVAREVIFHLQDLMREKQQPMFVGRHKELSMAEEKLLTYDDIGPRRMFIMFGLSGIGRRTLVRKISENFLSLQKTVEIRIQEGDEVKDIAIKLAEQAEVYTDIESLKALVSEIEKSSSVEALQRICADIKIHIVNGELPLFVDNGGLVDNDGNLAAHIVQIVDQLYDQEDAYLAMISTRKPYYEPDQHKARPLIPIIRVEPLSLAEVSRLIGKIATYNKISINSAQIDEIAEYIRGYPPAAHYAVELIREYGIDVILSNKHPLVEFRASHFISYISQSDLLCDERCILLSVLCYYSPLPLSVLGKVIKEDAEDMQKHLTYLIDTAIVIPDKNGHYRLSDPIVDSVQRVIDKRIVPHPEVASALKDYLKEVGDDTGLLELSRNLFKARRFSGEEGVHESEINLISDLISLTIEFYHSRDYENAVKMGKMSLNQRPESIEAKTFLVRALAQLERYEEAESYIKTLRDAGYLRDAYFLTGFIERQKEHIGLAIEAYEKAIQQGRRGLAVHRELANCYFQMKDLDKAKKHIDIAQRLEPDNKFIVDLQIIIAISHRDETSARDKLRILKEIDKNEFYEHRRSTIEYVFGSKNESFIAAKKAIESTERPTFAMLSQLVKSAISIGRIPEAEEAINRIEKRFKNIRQDNKIGLRCRLEISRNEFRNALGLWERLSDKEKSIHKWLKRDAISGILNNGMWIDEEEQKALKNELSSLEHEIKEDNIFAIDAELSR
jgi:tetratricopeptide (TPR) repeat protein